MSSDLDQLVAEAGAAFAAVSQPAALENEKARFLGKSGAITERLKGLGKLAPEEKREQGARINAAKEAIERLLAERRQALADAQLAERLSAESRYSRFMQHKRQLDPAALDRGVNPRPGREYEIHFECPEFTCVCPRTGQPDFATLRISYVPDALCVELKSLKLYLWSYRDEGHFHEDVTNRILDDLVALLAPQSLRVEGVFNVRGGIGTTVIVEHPD